MHDVMVAAVGLSLGAVWLVLLLLTGFNTVVVGGGVLAGLIAVERARGG